MHRSAAPPLARDVCPACNSVRLTAHSSAPGSRLICVVVCSDCGARVRDVLRAPIIRPAQAARYKLVSGPHAGRLLGDLAGSAKGRQYLTDTARHSGDRRLRQCCALVLLHHFAEEVTP